VCLHSSFNARADQPCAASCLIAVDRLVPQVDPPSAHKIRQSKPANVARNRSSFRPPPPGIPRPVAAKRLLWHGRFLVFRFLISRAWITPSPQLKSKASPSVPRPYLISGALRCQRGIVQATLKLTQAPDRGCRTCTERVNHVRVKHAPWNNVDNIASPTGRARYN
jgi:hypothetical protein